MKEHTTSTRKLGYMPEFWTIQACTFSQLVRTAEKRLFDLREKLKERYLDLPTDPILEIAVHQPKQLTLKYAGS